MPTSTRCGTRSRTRTQTFTLTGIIIGVGIFGAYAAIVAVYLAIAGLSPRKTAPVLTEAPGEPAADIRESATDERGTA